LAAGFLTDAAAAPSSSSDWFSLAASSSSSSSSSSRWRFLLVLPCSASPSCFAFFVRDFFSDCEVFFFFDDAVVDDAIPPLLPSAREDLL
jgi:hypothetical protein